MSAENVPWQEHAVTRAAPAGLLDQTPCVLWFTRVPAAGKSTIANRVTCSTGTYVRRGLNRDLGFTDAGRAENIRRVAEVARLMLDAGLIVLVSFISPFRSEREMARGLFAEGEFFEIFVDTPLAVAEQRRRLGLRASGAPRASRRDDRHDARPGGGQRDLPAGGPGPARTR